MPRLIHLNGPPAIGKSTLAELYVNRHDGVLNLDIDGLRPFIGGSRERYQQSGELVRRLALAMAQAHLVGGRDVILPQYLGRVTEIGRFETVARRSGATFCEVVLMDERSNAARRFVRRSESATQSWLRDASDTVDRLGGPTYLHHMYDQLLAAQRERPDAVVVDCVDGDVQQTYAALLAVLATSAGD